MKRISRSGGYCHPGSSVGNDEPHSRKGNQTRTAGEKCRASARLQIQASREKASGFAGPGFPRQKGRTVRPWLFLAQASGVPLLLFAKVEYTILAGKV